MSQDNPAYCATRGLTSLEPQAHPLWWTGPRWLSLDSSHRPASSIESPSDESLGVRTSPQKNDFISRFSELRRLLRITAWCVRIFKSAKDTPEERKVLVNSSLGVSELNMAKQR